MKVLWFSLSPCGSIRRTINDKVNHGWMISLEDAIKKSPEIELEVAFFSDVKEDIFVFDGVKYYPMGQMRLKNPVKRILNRRRSIIEIDRERMPLLIRVIDESKPDLIHIHGTEDSFGIIAPYAKNKRIPVVYSIQGLIAPYSELYFRGMNQHEAYKYDSWYDIIKNVGIRNNWQSFQQRAERERFFLSQADYIFGRTHWDKNCTLVLNPNRQYFAVNEILRPEFYRKRWKGYISNNRISIISIISGGIYKGMETVLKTAALLKQYGNIDFEWKVVGYDASSKWVHIAERITSITCKESNITLLGQLNADQLSDTLCQSDIYVHMSHIENSPNSVCEAMLVGMPIVASFAGGTSSILENRIEGILVQDGDPYGTAGAVLSYVLSPDTALKFGSAAYEKAVTRHNPSSVVDELLRGYNYILGNELYR